MRTDCIFLIFVNFLYILKGVHSDSSADETRLLSRRKRSTCAQKFSVISGHTACLSASANAQESGVSAAEQTLILNSHNNFRSGVSPTSTDMIKMTWDDEVASIAQKWADNCVTSHDSNYHRFIPGRLQSGQNLYMNYGATKVTWDQAVTAWHSEVSLFTFGGSNTLLEVGHYTQVVWAKSSKIGCGYANCGTVHYYVCNYSPPGNSDIDNPYTSGSSCSQCSSSCNNNLCDCAGLVCLNGGTMNVNTCTCSCPNYPHYVGNDCSLNCSLLQQNALCGTSVYVASNCPVYSNVPFDCPQTCNVCPYGGIDFNEQSSTTAATDTSSTMSSTPSTSTSSMGLTDSSPTTLTSASSMSTSSTASSTITTEAAYGNKGTILAPSIGIVTFVISIMNINLITNC